MIDLEALEKKTAKAKAKRSGGKKSSHFKPKKDTDYMVAILPPYTEVEIDGETEYVPFHQGDFATSFEEHVSLIGAGKTQSIECLRSIDESNECKVCEALRINAHEMHEHKMNTRFALRVLVLEDAPVQNKKGEKFYKPLIDEESGFDGQWKLWNVPKSVAVQFSEAYLAMLRELQKEGEEPTVSLNTLLAFSYNKTGNGKDTVHKLAVAGRRARVLNHLRSLSYEKDGEEKKRFPGEDKDEQFESIMKALSKPSTSELFVKDPDVYEVYVEGRNIFDYMSEKKNAGKNGKKSKNKKKSSYEDDDE